MYQAQFGKDTQLTIRMTITILLLGLLYSAFILVLLSLGASVVLVLVIAVVLVIVQFFFSNRMVLLSMRAKVVSPKEQPKLHQMVERLSVNGGIRKPRIAVSNMDIPNAFATGRSTSSATVAVTTGLMKLLNDREMEAVLAHELTHIKNKDVVVMTFASFFSVVASTLMMMFFWMGLFGGFGGRGRGGGGGYIMMAYMVTLIVWVLSMLLVSALSRYREFSADRGAAIITGQPGDLISALTRIHGSIAKIPKNDLRRAEKMNAFFILPAVGDSLANLFSTHPAVTKRIERLQRMQQTMGL